MKKKKNPRTEKESNQSPQNAHPATGEDLSKEMIPADEGQVSQDESDRIRTIPPAQFRSGSAVSSFDDKTQKILRERAHELSRVPGDSSLQQFIEVVVFGLGEELYAFRTQSIHEIRLVEDMTPVPCTPAHVIGVTNIRGLIYSIIDLSQFLGLEPAVRTEESRLILAGSEGVELGFFVDRILNKLDIPMDQLKRSTSSIRGIQEEKVEGIVSFQSKMVIVLELNQLLKDDRIIIMEHVS